MRAIIFVLALVLLTGLSLTGCGGGGTASSLGSGDMRLSIVWPELETGNKFIPKAAQSLVITVDNGAGFIQSQTVPRPADDVNSTVTFTDVPVGEVAVIVVAYPNPDGTGIPLATAQAVATVINRQTVSVTLDMTSTVVAVSIDQYPTDITDRETAQLLATARDADGDIVPVLPQPDGFYWTTSDTSIASIDQHGVLTPQDAGTVRVTVYERETGVSAFVDLLIKPSGGTLVIIIVNSPIAVTISPETASVDPGATVQFSATVTGVPNQHVLWSVAEPNGGVITKDGLYTAPATPGTYHVVAASMADIGKTATATVTVGDRPIVFCGYRDGNYDIYRINPDGSNEIRLTTDPGADTYPAVSPDGTKLAFSSQRVDGRYHIFVMNIDGSGLTPLTSGSYHEYQPAWSPDGTRIAYHSSNSGNLYLMNADGSGQTQLTSSVEYDMEPTFVTNDLIVFTSDRDYNEELYRINTDGTGLMRLTSNNERDNHPTASPDGTYLVFTSERDHVGPELYRMNIDGTNVVRLTDDTYHDEGPCFSHDGTQLVFTSARTTLPGVPVIFTMNADGTNIRQVTAEVSGEYSIQPSW